MNKRTNQDYTIIVSITLPDCEYVLGEKKTETKEPKYVTWCCVNGTYYYGHYIDDLNVATRDLYERANRELTFRIERLNDKIKGAK